MISVPFIVIEGNIGAGKTTLATMLSKDLNGRLILERFADNPFLPKFYKEPERWAFTLELSFLADRYKQLKEELLQPSLFDQYIIADYYFMKSLIFSKQTLAEDEFNLYKQLFEIIYYNLPKPNIFVYLHAPIEKIMYQIKLRGRSYEQDISKEYLQNIHNNYLEFIDTQKNIPVLIINTENLDFVNNPSDYKQIKNTIFEHLNKKGIHKKFFISNKICDSKNDL
ncbi:MAG: deoxynucleoside kinase [Bacteroidales bacterium]|nr:deoxynucleoside kinase [Bacteroidales bacterium]